MRIPQHIALAKPGLYTDVVRGLRLRIGPSSRTWVYRFRLDDGKRRLLKQVVVGHFPQMSLMQARTKVLDLKASRKVGAQPKRILEGEQRRQAEGRAQAERDRLPVSEVVAAYGAQHIEKARSAKGRAEVLRLFRRLPPEFLNMPALKIDRAAAHALIQSFEAPSVKRVLGRELRAAWRWGIDSGMLPETATPFERLRLPKQGKRTRYLNDAELKLLLPWLASLPRTSRDVLHLMLLTGARPAEICNLRWADIQGNVAQLRKTKTDTPRDLHLSRQARALLAARPRGTGRAAEWVFPSPVVRGKALNQKAAYLGIYGKRDSVPVPDFTLYDARKTFRTGLARLGCPQEVAELMIGHSKAGIVGVYDLSSRPEQQREWAGRWCDHLDALQASQ